MAAQALLGPGAPAPAMTPPHLLQRRILVADDDREVRLGVAELLAGLGLEILHAATGTEAVELVRGTRIHAALLDMHMPGCTGLQILTLVRTETLGVPCILLSGEANEIMCKSALQEGAVAVFKKPYTPRLLRDEVRRVLRLSA